MARLIPRRANDMKLFDSVISNRGSANVVMLKALIAMCFLLPFTVSTSSAQDSTDDDEDNVIEEILVTASKRGRVNAQDLAASITAFDANKLERLDALDFDDFIVHVPGTNFISDGGPGRGNEVASIRGLSTVADNTVGVVAQYLDGAPHFGNSYRLFDIGEVSVLRGPQGTLWGSQSIGGLISFRSNRPDPSQFDGMVQGDVYSSDNDGGTSYRASGMVNIPVVSDKFAVRFAGHHVDESGYIENIRTGTKGINNVKESAWRLSALFEPSENTTVTAIYHGNDLEADAPTYFQLDLGDLKVDQPSDFGPAFQDYDLFNLMVDVNLGWGQFNYTGSNYSNVGSYLDFGDAGSGFSRNDTNIDEDATTHEIRLASQGDSAWQWIVGFYKDDYDKFLQGVSLSLAELNDPMPTESVRNGGLRIFQEEAIFGEVSYDFSDKFRVLVGGRFFDWELETQEVFLFGGTDFGFVTNGIASDDDFFYKVQVDYQVNEDVLVYGTRSEGFRYGGFNTFVGEALFGISEQFFQFGPDTLVNYEVGVKSRLADNQVTLNVAIYFLDWQEVQAVVQSDMAGAFGQGFFTTNAPDLEAKGLELELVTQDYFYPGLYAAFSFAYTDNEFQDDAQLFSGTRVTIHKGDSLRRTPKYAWSVDLGYEFQFSNDLDGFVRTNYWHKDSTSTFGFNGNDGNVNVPSQNVINFSAGATWDDKQVKFYINNLNNEDPLLNVFSGNSVGFPGSDQAIRANTIRSRTFGLEFTAYFSS